MIWYGVTFFRLVLSHLVSPYRIVRRNSGVASFFVECFGVSRSCCDVCLCACVWLQGGYVVSCGVVCDKVLCCVILRRMWCGAVLSYVVCGVLLSHPTPYVVRCDAYRLIACSVHGFVLSCATLPRLISCDAIQCGMVVL